MALEGRPKTTATSGTTVAAAAAILATFLLASGPTPVFAAQNLNTNPCGPIPVVDNGRLVIYMNPPIPDGEGKTAPARLRVAKITYECDEGYILMGDASVVCNEENLMYSTIPTCFANNSCGAAPEIDDAEIIWQTFTEESGYGDQVSYACNKRYVLSGLPTITCQLNGRWTVRPDCGTPASRGCGTPPAFEYGTIVEKSYFDDRRTILGDFVAFGCEPSHVLDGPSLLRCNGTHWRPDPPICIYAPDVGCGPAPWVENAQITYRSFVNRSSEENDFVTFACNPGYTSDDYMSSSCSASQQWGKLPVCQKIKVCDYPPIVRHGRVYIKDYKTYPIVGSNVTYICFNGYKSVGNLTITCQDDLTWSRPPICNESATFFCPAFLPMGNGSIVDRSYDQSALARPGDTVTVRCNPGYRMFGPKIVRCLISLRWSARPACIRDVPPPPPQKMVTGIVPANTPSTTPSTLLGPLVCDKPPSFPYAIITAQSFAEKTQAKPGDIVVYVCDNGYERAKGSSTSLLCVQNKWLGSIRCEPKSDSCISPLNVENARLVRRSFTGNRGLTDDTITYACDYGYTLVNERNVEETPSGSKMAISRCDNGRWLNLPVCIPNNKADDRHSCSGGPPDMRRAVQIAVGDGTFTTGDFVIYQCGPDFVLSNDPLKSAYVYEDDERHPQPMTTVKCQDNGAWSDPPVCNPKPAPTATCGAIPSLAPNILVITAEGVVGSPPSNKLLSQVGDYILVDCKPGFELDGAFDRVLCQEDGTWSKSPRCVAVTCGAAPPVPNRAMVLFQSFSDMSASGDSIIYRCRTGYRLTNGVDRVRCENNGQWSDAPSCQRIIPQRSNPYSDRECYLPAPLPQDTSIIYSTFGENNEFTPRTGDFIVFGCPPGYSVMGNATVQCTEGGTWSRPPPCSVGGSNSDFRGGRLRGPRCLKGITDTQHTSCLDDSVDLLTVRPVNVAQVLDEHNFYRFNVTPPAKGMRNMTWDDELAATAERWAAQCTTANDDARHRTVPQKGWRWVGQNIFASARDFSIKQAIGAWADEGRYWAYGIGSTDPSQVVGHYTQIIWQQTLYIGCGIAKCDNRHIPLPNILVCNYAPGGNTAFVGQNPYATPYEPVNVLQAISAGNQP